MTAMKCSLLPWSTHSLRRGGASELSRLNVGMADIMAFGLWASSRAVQEYVRRGEVALLQVDEKFSKEAWATIARLACLGASVFGFTDSDESDSD
mgnify:CR=1 FL=1